MNVDERTIRVVSSLKSYKDYSPREYITMIVKDAKPEFEYLLKDREPKLPDTRLNKLVWVMGRCSGKVFMQRRLLIKFLFPEIFKSPSYVECLFHGKEKFNNVRK